MEDINPAGSGRLIIVDNADGPRQVRCVYDLFGVRPTTPQDAYYSVPRGDIVAVADLDQDGHALLEPVPPEWRHRLSFLGANPLRPSGTSDAFVTLSDPGNQGDAIRAAVEAWATRTPAGRWIVTDTGPSDLLALENAAAAYDASLHVIQPDPVARVDHAASTIHA